nr:MAG TPA: hypothetical protein [Caudoviricetes sp.]
MSNLHNVTPLHPITLVHPNNSQVSASKNKYKTFCTLKPYHK